MEEDIRAFFIKIINTIAAILLWLFINIALGLKLKFAEVQQHFTIGNTLFYIWVILSGAFVFYYVVKIWRKHSQ
ncbi:hypothetical protein [Hydrotalea sp.]|uniref:hypothetical protein n=1 Tax=Hydrotalea sp. TaxID=2881279 RepID=UPI00263A04AF|nr:hypothetical protein [Hydrotalea sp.]